MLAAHRHPSQVWGSAADDAALPASAQDLQAGPPDEEGGAGGSQGVQGDLPGKVLLAVSHYFFLCVFVCVCRKYRTEIPLPPSIMLLP